jgi:CBS domain-containing protein
MKVKEICTRAVRSCTPDTRLSDAGWSMWEGDCGILPVVDDSGKVVGVITDRDICMSASTKYRPAAEIAVREACSGKVLTCRGNDDVRDALKTMRQAGLRRLPVVDAQGKLAGILSLNDIALASQSDRPARPADVTYEDLALAMKAICERRAAAKSKEPIAMGLGTVAGTSVPRLEYHPSGIA